VAGIAAISLAVAGILVMNVMLVAVTQRTAEIGLLKALGARGATIRDAFLAEAAMISLVGALTGLGAFTFRYAQGLSYLSNDPKACTNCHIMNEQFALSQTTINLPIALKPFDLGLAEAVFLLIMLVHSLISANLVSFAGGSHKHSFYINFAIITWISTVTAIVTQLMLDKVLNLS